MACTALVGINWGDEGKGRMVDLLAEAFDIVVRFQGGANAGHKIINKFGKFDLHLLPSGVCRPGVVNILGNGVALDPDTLIKEIKDQKGIEITPDILMISERASLLLPWHRELDVLEEARLKDKRDGSTKQGIAPFYSDKNQKKTILAGELFYPERLKKHVKELCAWKNLTLEKIYGAKPASEKELTAWLNEYCEPIKPFIKNTRDYLIKADSDHKRILFEAQLGALRDLDFGIYPYTTSVSTLASYAPIGAGVPGVEVDRVIGVIKAYSTCLGDGPFVTEYTGEKGDQFRKMCGEDEPEGGRIVRIGPIDLVASKYGTETQAATELALTKLDMLSDLEEIPLCVGYKLDGQVLTDMPFPAALDRCEPVYETMKGWKCNISGVRNWWDLPEEAKAYVNRIEHAVGCVIRWISVGPERHSIIRRG